MAVHFHEEDLPGDVRFADGPIAIDTEAMGLLPGRDRLCLVQISDGQGDEHLVRFGPASDYAAPNLKALLADPERIKLYHFARFDLAIMHAYLGVMANISRVAALKQAVVSNKSALSATEAGYEVGTRTTVDVLNTRTGLFLAQRNYTQARYDYVLATLRLKNSTGSLASQDLKQINGWLKK